jgi:hypothetical protein
MSETKRASEITDDEIKDAVKEADSLMGEDSPSQSCCGPTVSTKSEDSTEG